MENTITEKQLALPKELVDHIIDHLHDDGSTLQSCARVSKSWRTESQFHIFSKISLKALSPLTGTGTPQGRCARLYDVLQNNESLVPYIRELEICEGSPPSFHHPQNASFHQHSTDVQVSTTWVTTERTLIKLFRMLTNVRRLDFSSTSTIFWTLLPPTFQEALFVLLGRKTLQYVRLHCWLFPNFACLSAMLSHCHGLRAFALSATSISNDYTTDNGAEHDDDGDRTLKNVHEDKGEREAPAHELIPSTSLEVLTLDFVDFAYLEYWLLGRSSLLDIKSLRELRVAHFHDAEIISKLLQAIGGSLEHFHLKPGSWEVHPFNLSLNTGLRSMRLTLEDPETAMKWVTELLSTISSNNVVLDSVGLEFFSDPKKITGWEGLDALFMRPVFSSLKQVEIGLFAQPTSPDFVMVKEEMSGLSAKGIARWYQLGIKSQRSSRQLMPRISRYES